MAQTITGIQEQPLTGSPFNLGREISSTQGTSPAGIQTQQAPSPTEPSSLDLKSELATIKAIRAGAPQQGGIAQTIGQVGGTGAAMALGADPMTASAIGGVAGSVGSIVDYMIEKDARDEAKIIRENALRKEKNRQVKKAATNSWLESMASMRGVALSEEQERMDKDAVAKSMRENFMVELMNKIAQGAQRDEVLKNKFLKSRSL